MTIQYIILGAILLACIIYAVWRIKKALSVKSGGPCYGCALKDVCQKNKRRDQCENKKRGITSAHFS